MHLAQHAQHAQHAPPGPPAPPARRGADDGDPVAAAGALARDLPGTLATWPWRETLAVLGRRFREDRLGLTAGSLTFTTLIALVPLVTVVFAVFSLFPMFAGFERALQEFFLANLVPESIARPVLRALRDFAGKASGMGTVGLVLLVATALALLLTIDRTLNAIWRVRQPRPLAQRVLVYWAALTLGPLALGLSLTATSLALAATRGWTQPLLPGGGAWLIDALQFALLAAAATGLYRYVPNTAVRWRHAIAGGLFVAIGFEAAKVALALYLETVPLVNAVYGAFAALPILLLWVYLVWVIVLLGAVIAAYAPSLSMRLAPRPSGPGWRYDLSLQLLAALALARRTGQPGLGPAALARQLRTDPLLLESLVDPLHRIGWVGRLEEQAGEARLVLLVDADTAPLAPLLQATLLGEGEPLDRLLAAGGLGTRRLADVLPEMPPAAP